MSGLRLHLLCDAVCHRGNSPSQLASLGVRKELVKSGCYSLTVHHDHMNEVCSDHRMTGESQGIVFDVDVIVIDRAYWISPWLQLRSGPETDENTASDVCLCPTVFWVSDSTSPEVRFKELKCLLSVSSGSQRQLQEQSMTGYFNHMQGLWAFRRTGRRKRLLPSQNWRKMKKQQEQKNKR